MDNLRFWDFLAKQNQEDFRSSGTAGSCIEARELIISLPEEFQKYDREQLLKLFVMKFKQEYGTDVVAALHHNKAMTNYHIHLIFSERKLLEHAEFKKASRNMFFDEHGRHVRTKKAIRESIEKTGFHPDLLSAILQATIRVLLDLIRAIPKKVHKEPVFDAEVFRRMQEVRKDLLHQNQVIAEPDKIFKRAGYKNVAAFTREYEKSCKLLESIQRKKGDKRSVLAKLEQCTKRRQRCRTESRKSDRKEEGSKRAIGKLRRAVPLYRYKRPWSTPGRTISIRCHISNKKDDNDRYSDMYARRM